MIWRTILIIISFYSLALLQVSFFGRFDAWGFTPNLIFAAVILVNLFSPAVATGFLSAMAGGFFWDVFSSQPFGFHVLFLLVIVAFIHFFLRKYVRSPLN